MKLEEMSEFFNHRVNNYEDHMLHNVKGADRFYAETAKLIPRELGLHLLDLGCGTGLELDEIFKINPTIKVTGIDMSKDMIEKIKQKHADKLAQMTLIVDNYFNCNMGKNKFDVAMSVQTLHHFTYEEKTRLYMKINDCLKTSGFYIETDYIAPNQEYEDYHYSEYRRIRSELGITDGFYHYDIPCTIENQIRMLHEAGFKFV